MPQNLLKTYFLQLTSIFQCHKQAHLLPLDLFNNCTKKWLKKDFLSELSSVFFSQTNDGRKVKTCNNEMYLYTTKRSGPLSKQSRTLSIKKKKRKK